MMTITGRLFEIQDEKNADFQAKLTPGIPREKFLGVRMPAARKLAKEIIKEAKAGGPKSKGENSEVPEQTETEMIPSELERFLNDLPHEYYDENILHALLLSEEKDYETCISKIEKFLPYVDNWAVCDIMSPKCFKKHRRELIEKVKTWAASDELYTCRFGIDMLMGHFLDEDFDPSYLEIAAAARSEEYYVKMVVAWYFTTALAKQWEAAVPYIEKGVLEKWTHNKTIQKSRESFRVTDDHKEYLKGLKR